MNRKILLLLVSLSVPFGAGAQETPDSTPLNYVIQASDVLRMQVFQEPDLMQELRVPQNGEVQLPLIGTVDLKGKTVAEAQEIITKLYDRDYLVNPQVNLLILEFSQRRVKVLGAVNSPGTVIFPPDEEMNLVDAISLAGGFNRLARKTAVTLTRTEGNGEVTNYRINVDELIRGGADSSVWKLQKDDTIYVPERIF